MNTFASMESYRNIVMASQRRCLTLVPTRLSQTGQVVALLVAEHVQGNRNFVVPMAMLMDPELVDESGFLAVNAMDKLDELLMNIRSVKHQPWFLRDSQNRIVVAFAKLGEVPTVADAKLVLPWANPFELFQDPTWAAQL